jgi:hypothetical protein
MRSRLNQAFIFTIVCAVVLAEPRVAPATSNTLCNADAMNWPSNFYQTVRNTFSMPQGSMRDAAYLNAIAQLNEAVNVVSHFGDDDPSKNEITYGDGYNSVAVVLPENIDGRDGRCLRKHWCAWGHTTGYIEADVMISSKLDFAPPEESAVVRNGRSVFLHEFGHAHGLDHDMAFLNVMGDLRAFPLVGGPGEHAVIFPDDAYGLRALYPSRAVPGDNLFASAQRLVQGSIVGTTFPTAITRCPGQSILLYFTVGNVSRDGHDVRVEFHLNPSPPPGGYVNGTLLGVGPNPFLVPQNATRTGNATFNIPTGLAPGLYHVYMYVINPFLTESRDWDNVAHLAMTINIVSCT